ncbi:ABC transporter permease [Novosphingobium colocasiae]
MVAGLAMIQVLMVAALSVSREREQGTFDQLLVTPLTPAQILIGKAVPSILVGLMQSTLVMAINTLWFHLPFNGSLVLFYFGMLSFMTSAVGIGLAISAIALNMQQAMLYTFFVVMPLMLLSGLITPGQQHARIPPDRDLCQPLALRHGPRPPSDPRRRRAFRRGVGLRTATGRDGGDPAARRLAFPPPPFMIDHGTPHHGAHRFAFPPLWLAASLLALALAGCTVGPDFKAPAPAAPQDWTEWHSGDAATPLPADLATDLRPDWWRNFGDPVLDELETRALAGSPDLETAALHFAQARVQQGAVSSQALPQVNASAGATRIRQSENGASTRLFDAIAGGNRDALAKFLSDPFTLYQGGFDAGWEPDLWGRVSRSIEAVGAQTQGKAALLDAARISIVGDVAQTYFELREQQRRIALARDLIATLTDQTALVRARMQGGAQNGIDLDQQSATLKQAEAQLPALIAAETAGRNRLTLLLGQHPGALDDLLRPPTGGRAGPACPRPRRTVRPSPPPSGHPRRRSGASRRDRASGRRGGRSLSVDPHRRQLQP